MNTLPNVTIEIKDLFTNKSAERIAAEVGKRLADGFRAGTSSWDGKLVKTVTSEEHREIHGMKPLPPTTDTNVTKAHRKRCEYCGVISERDYGTCAHCGAPL